MQVTKERITQTLRHHEMRRQSGGNFGLPPQVSPTTTPCFKFEFEFESTVTRNE